MKPTGPLPCVLCREVRDLRDSHILSRGLGKRVMEARAHEQAKDAPTNRLTVAGGRAFLKDELPHDYLCCDSCEAVFKSDEDYMLDVVVQRDGSFPWFEGAIEPDCSPIARFAVGVVHRFTASRYAEAANLGPYRRPMADYILHGGPIPENVHVVVVLSKTLKTVLTLPFVSRFNGYRVYPFWACGVGLHVLIGKAIPSALDGACVARGGIVTRDVDDRVALPTIEDIARSRLVGKAAKMA